MRFKAKLFELIEKSNNVFINGERIDHFDDVNEGIVMRLSSGEVDSSANEWYFLDSEVKVNVKDGTAVAIAHDFSLSRDLDEASNILADMDGCPAGVAVILCFVQHRPISRQDLIKE